MRKFNFLFLLAVMLSCSATHALQYQDRTINRSMVVDGTDHTPRNRGFLCEDCRDLNEHPMDAVAFAYNGYFGELPWMREAGLGIPFRIYTIDGVWVLVWFEDVLFDLPNLLPDLMEVLVRMPDGRVLRFTILQDGPDLPVGLPEFPPDEAPDTADGDGSGDGDDDFEEPDDFEDIDLEEWDRFGHVDIVDPDDEGDFPDWEEEV